MANARPISIDEFAKQVGDHLEEFVTHIKEAREEGADGFGPRYEYKSFSDWLDEFGAFDGYIGLTAHINRARAADRRKGLALVDRRRDLTRR